MITKTILIADDAKLCIFSDLHRGDGSVADSFLKNKIAYNCALAAYLNDGFTYIEAGDGDELWKFDFDKVAYAYKDTFALINDFNLQNRFIYMTGNHNNEMTKPKFLKKWVKDSDVLEGMLSTLEPVDQLTLTNPNIKNIHIEHGHKGELLEDKIWRVGRFIVRYFWKPLSRLGFADPTVPIDGLKKSGRIDQKLYDISVKNDCFVIAGHTHRPVMESRLKGEPYTNKVSRYFNDGCGVFPSYITAFEIQGLKIALVKWCIGSKDGVLCVVRVVLTDWIDLREVQA